MIARIFESRSFKMPSSWVSVKVKSWWAAKNAPRALDRSSRGNDSLNCFFGFSNITPAITKTICLNANYGIRTTVGMRGLCGAAAAAVGRPTTQQVLVHHINKRKAKKLR